MRRLSFPGSHNVGLLLTGIVLAAALIVQAQIAIVDTCRGPTVKSTNMFESDWYVYDDNPKAPDNAGAYDKTLDKFSDSLAGGNSKITNFSKKDITEYESFYMTPGGNPNGTPAYCAMMAFKFGDTLPHYGQAAEETYGGYVGLGTGLISEGNVLDLRKATKITYWAKASDTITCSFLFSTDQGRFKFFGTFYQVDHKITPEWKEYYVLLDTINTSKDSIVLAQPGWAKEENPWYPGDPIGQYNAILPLDKTRAILLGWSLGGAGETGVPNELWKDMPGTLWVDDVKIEGYTWFPEDACMECDTALNTVKTLPGKPILLTEGGWIVQGLKEGAWYAFNDAKGRAVSKPIVEYSWIDTAMATYSKPDTTMPQLKLLDKTGVTGALKDTAAHISYTLGPKYRTPSTANPLDTNDVDPFVGVGLSLVNEDDAKQVYNMDSAKVKGIYFDYKTTGTAQWLYVSVDTRQTLLEDGARFYVKIPGSNGAWKGAIVPFENLDLPPWDDKDTAAFDATKAIAIQWSVEADSGDIGTFSIDNVYLLDTARVGIRYLTSPVQTQNGFSLRRMQQSLVYTMPHGVKHAIVELYNLQGRVVYSQRVKANMSGAYTLPLNTAQVTNGVYVFRMRTLGDRQQVFSKAVTLVK